MRLSISRAVTLAIGATIVLSASVAALAVTFSVQANTASGTALNSLLPALRSSDQLLADMVDQETGERGYVITAQSSFLQPYNQGRRAVTPLVHALRRDLAAEPKAASLLNRALRRYDDWLETFAEPQIKAVAAGNTTAAINEEKTGTGKALFDALRSSFAGLVRYLEDLDHSATTRVSSLQAAVLWLIVAFLVLLALGTVVGATFLRRWVIGPIRLLEREVSEASAGLSASTVTADSPAEVRNLGIGIESMRARLLLQGAELGEQRQVVSTLQGALLPRQLPAVEGFEVAARYLPAAREAAIGGDWYNVRPAGPQRAFVAVGDVVGSGVEAAALMASLRYAINAYAAEDPDPASVLTRLSGLFDTAADDRFATVVCCLLDARDHRARFASAGHPTPLLLAELKEPVPLAPGPPIGLGPHTYGATSVPIVAGATILVYSDGLVERRDEALDVSLGRLAGRLHPDQSLESLLDEVMANRAQPSADDAVACGIRVVRASG